MAQFQDKVSSTDSLRVGTGSVGNVVDAVKIVPAANAAAGNVLTITNASQGQATTLTIPDCGALTGQIQVGVSGFIQEPVCTITAGTVQTHAGATAITAPIAVVTTGNASDGVILPALAAWMVGTQITLINTSAAAGVVYCPGTTSTNTINGTAGATGVAYAASKTLYLVAVSATAWRTTLSN